MTTSRQPRFGIRLTAVVLAAVSLGGCNALQRLSEVGEAPAMSDIRNPVAEENYRPVSMPMPTPQELEPSHNSLWRPGARAFFEDQRAGDVGDILTVLIRVENERAALQNTTSRTRDASESAGLPALLGLEGSFGQVLPEAVDPDNLLEANSGSNASGSGSISRQETIDTRLAAVVLQVLPNGNLVIGGRQEVRVNNELRELSVTGVVRPQDIRSDNTIALEQIAEARVSYGGRGTLSDVQQPRYGQQIFDIIFPF